VRAAVFGLGATLALGIAAPRPAPAAASAKASSAGVPRAPTIYHKSRSFRIPFNVDPADKPRLVEVQLWVSDDSGYTWKMVSRTTPDRPSFTFRAARDADYWFAVRTLDTKGRLYPKEDEPVEPSMKVVVDTHPPALLLEPDGRRGSVAAVRWEVRDEHLDLATLLLEYQPEGGHEWRQAPLRRAALIGRERWDAGTAEPLKVRASIADKAGNTAEAVIVLPEGAPTSADVAAIDTPEIAEPPPISQISSGAADLPIGGDDLARAPDRPDAFPPRVPPASSGGGGQAPFGADPAPFADARSTASPRERETTAVGAGGRRTLLVPSPRFALQYAVDDAGPSGPAVVELWVSQDGGRTWIRLAEDPDRVSPFPVDLGGEGTFGLCLVARAATGLGDQPPAPGDSPQMWVEVDSSPPQVRLDPPQVGTGGNAGKVAIVWHANDLHLGPRPVVLSWRPDQPGARWLPITEPIENTGQYIWTVPASVPPRFHLRVDVVDSMGNRGWAESTEFGAVIVDRARPRSRIIGLDPTARTGAGPAARPLR
jgi:hypothetical protein